MPAIDGTLLCHGADYTEFDQIYHAKGDKDMKKTVLIADADFVFAKQLSRALEEIEKFQVIDIALNGKQAVRMVEERHPDVLVMDILLPELDGLSVLEKISSITPLPIIIATSSFLSNYVAMAALDLGVRQIIKKPCDAESIATSVERACRIIPRKGSENDRGCLIANTLHDVGVPANIKGYTYLINALDLAIANSEAAFSMTQSIYAPIAQQHGVKPEQVSRAITRAIDIAWDRGDLDTLQSYFGYTVSNTRGMPTNGEFVSIIGEKLRFQLDAQNMTQE